MPIFYARGGAMMMRASISSKDENGALLFVDSSAFYPLALDDGLLKRAGADLASFRSQPGAPPAWKMGPLPFFKLGGMDLSQFPAVQGAPFSDYKQTFDVDLSGVAGAGLLSIFRVTFADEGRWLWLELDPTVMGGPQQGGPPQNGAPQGPGPASSGAPAQPEPPKATPPGKGVTAPKLEPPKPTSAPGAKSDGPKTPPPTSDSKGAAK
jgi:hypothetical protein